MCGNPGELDGRITGQGTPRGVQVPAGLGQLVEHQAGDAAECAASENRGNVKQSHLRPTWVGGPSARNTSFNPVRICGVRGQHPGCGGAELGKRGALRQPLLGCGPVMSWLIMAGHWNCSSAYMSILCATCGVEAASGGWRGSGGARCVLLSKILTSRVDRTPAWGRGGGTVVAVGSRRAGRSLRVAQRAASCRR